MKFTVQSLVITEHYSKPVKITQINSKIVERQLDVHLKFSWKLHAQIHY